MALKPDREYNESSDITNFWTTVTAEKGGVASVVTQGSGSAMGENIVDHPNVVGYSASASGAIPKGVLLQTVSPVMSATRDFINFENQEIRPGDKCTLITHGWLVTDMIIGTPSAGDIAYLGASGNITPTSGAFGGATTPVIGRFETTQDADGFARVSVQIT